MLKVQLNRIVWLMFVGLLMAILAVSVVGAAVHSQFASIDSLQTIELSQTQKTDANPTAIIACNGGSDGSCGGY